MDLSASIRRKMKFSNRIILSTERIIQKNIRKD
jgi:hypothetical protein